MKRAKGGHKQSKRLTIMFIPSSTDAKVKNISAPYWLYVVVGLPLLCVLIAPLLLLGRILTLEGYSDFSSLLLPQAAAEEHVAEETPDGNAAQPNAPDAENASAGIESGDLGSISANNSNSGDAEGTKDAAAPSRDEAELRRLGEMEDRLRELLARSNTVDGLVQNIVDIFERLEALDIPFTFNLQEAIERGGEVSMGGPFPGPVDQVLIEMDAILSGNMLKMQALEAYAELLENYFNARPNGFPVDGREIAFGFDMLTESPLSGGFERHDGIDIAMPPYSNIYATADGVVRFADWNDSGYGNLVILDHDYSYSTYYAHASALLVKAGEEVKRGQVIALVGSTGRSADPHIHYEVRINEIPQDPASYFIQG